MQRLCETSAIPDGCIYDMFSCEREMNLRRIQVFRPCLLFLSTSRLYVDGESWPMWHRPSQGIWMLSVKDQECVWSRCWNNTRWIPNLPILNFQSKKVYFSISNAPKGCTLCKIQRSSWNSTGWILNHWDPLLASDYNANPLPR